MVQISGCRWSIAREGARCLSSGIGAKFARFAKRDDFLDIQIVGGVYHISLFENLVGILVAKPFLVFELSHPSGVGYLT